MVDMRYSWNLGMVQ